MKNSPLSGVHYCENTVSLNSASKVNGKGFLPICGNNVCNSMAEG